jgi:hypothetical protein
VNFHKQTVLVYITSKVEVSTKESGKDSSLCPLKMNRLDVRNPRLNILQVELRKIIATERIPRRRVKCDPTGIN